MKKNKTRRTEWKKKTVVTTHVDDFEFTYYDRARGKYVAVPREESCNEAAKSLDCSSTLLSTVIDSMNLMKGLISDDLKEMYQQVKNKK